MKIRFGNAYYPEDWDNARVEYDAELMRKAGMNLVRMGEFAWSHMEPREGEYRFDWLVDAVRIMGEHGIRTILCTPSSAAPAWMCRKYPDVLRMKRNGEKAWFGVRDHTCYTSKTYRKFVRRITEKMVRIFKDNPYVAGWQIDNEPGSSRFPACFCPDCQEKFREYLKKKYKTIENLNEQWHTQFWSGEFSCWEDIDLEASHAENMQSCRTTESRRFRSHEQADFILFQAEIIRKAMPGTVIGTNNYCDCDWYEAFSKLDYAGNDYYPTYMGEDMLNCVSNKFNVGNYAGIKQDVSPWIMETPPYPGSPMKNIADFFCWFYIAFGYNDVFYFHWNNHLSGNEKIHQTIIRPSGKPGPQYEYFKKMISGIDKTLAPYGDLPLPRSKCAIINDYETSWVYSGNCPRREIALVHAKYEQFTSLCRANGFAEIISPDADWSRYSLVVLPVQAHIHRSMAEKIRRYVKNGGVILTNGCAGSFDGNSNNLPEDGPERLQDVFGFTYGEGYPFGSNELPVFENTKEYAAEHPVVSGKVNGKTVRGSIDFWTSFLTLSTAKTVMKFENSDLKGEPFCTVNSYGKGYAVYYAADLIDQALCDEIVKFASAKAGLKQVPWQENISVMQRGPLMFVHNFSGKSSSFPFRGKGKNVIGSSLKNGKITMPPVSFAVIEVE